MASTDQDKAKEELRKRQREICLAVINAGEKEGATRRQCNEALRAAGLPTIDSEDDFNLVMNGPLANHPAHNAAQYLIWTEMNKLLEASQNYTPDAQISEVCAEMGMKMEDVWAKARQAVIDELIRRGDDPNDQDAIIELYNERCQQEAA